MFLEIIIILEISEVLIILIEMRILNTIFFDLKTRDAGG